MEFHLNALWLVGMWLLVESPHAALLQDSGSKRSSHLPRRFQIHKIPTKLSAPPVTPPHVEHQPPPRPPSAINRGVAVKCHPDSMEVVVRADLLDTGLFVEAGHLYLGSPGCHALPSAEAEYTIHVNLMDCGTTLSSTEETIVYSNVLVYSPEPSPDGLLRLEGVTVPVQCRYNKRYAVDGLVVQPDWVPFASAVAAEDHIEFMLRLMTDDWQHERESLTYFLGDPIRVEASIIMSDHMPLRIYADHCVATVTPELDATPRYDFIERHGCLTDAYLTDSGSRYLPRVQEDKLQFWLDAFRFYQELTNRIYITCQLKAVPTTLLVCPMNRACSFIHNRWQSVDGNDQACASCAVGQQFLDERVEQETPPPPSPRALMTNVEPLAGQTVATRAGMLQTEAKLQAAANYVRYRPRGHLAPFSSSGLIKRGAEWIKTTTISGPLVILPKNDSDAKEPANSVVSVLPAPHQPANAG